MLDRHCVFVRIGSFPCETTQPFNAGLFESESNCAELWGLHPSPLYSAAEICQCAAEFIDTAAAISCSTVSGETGVYVLGEVTFEPPGSVTVETEHNIHKEDADYSVAVSYV